MWKKMTKEIDWIIFVALAIIGVALLVLNHQNLVFRGFAILFFLLAVATAPHGIRTLIKNWKGEEEEK